MQKAGKKTGGSSHQGVFSAYSHVRAMFVHENGFLNVCACPNFQHVWHGLRD